MSARTIGPGRQPAQTPRWSRPTGIGPISRRGGRPFCPVRPGPGTAPSTAAILAAAGQWQPDGLASLAALRVQAAAITARWQPGRDATCLTRQITAELALKTADTARCEREGDLAPGADVGYGPTAELDLCLDAAANALGDLQASGCANRRPAPRTPPPLGAGSSLPARQPVTLTFSAWGPFWPWVMSNSTFCPSSRLR